MYKVKKEMPKHTFYIESEKRLQRAVLTEISSVNGVSVYRADFAFEKGVESGTIGISIRFPMKNILQIFAPTTDFKRNRMVWQWFNPTSMLSSFASGLPSLSAVKDGKNNYVTVAASEAECKCTTEFFADDFFGNDEVVFRLWLFQDFEQKNDYRVFIRIDERDIPLSETLREQTQWFSEFYHSEGSYPEACEYPLYSTWYNFHQNPSAAKLKKELIVARELGFRSVILDDGWQSDGTGSSGYESCGDWEFSKEKFPDVKEFLSFVHSLDMKIVLWFSVPFVGNKSSVYERFKDKFLYKYYDGTGILDVRYKEAREFVVNTVRRLMKYGFDGMKLDFIDSFKLQKDSPVYNDKMDTKEVSAATVKLVSDLYNAIKSVNREAMIEFRQDYVGPSIVRFGNMLRVADCAFDSITNRIGIADLRMLNYNLAIHSDMLYWAKSESDENVARQLTNIMFGVPQISVLLNEDSRSHKEVIKKFIEYWEANKNILLHGEFETEGEDCTYSMLAAKGKDKAIVALYLKNYYTYKGKNADIFNGTSEEKTYIDAGKLSCNAKIYDCKNRLADERSISGITAINVPLGGRVELR